MKFLKAWDFFETVVRMSIMSKSWSFESFCTKKSNKTSKLRNKTFQCFQTNSPIRT